MSERINVEKVELRKGAVTMRHEGAEAHDYSIKVFWSEEDEGYIAVCPELEGISAYGESREDALRELDVAIDLVLEDLRDRGEPIPEPASRKAFSG